MPNGSCGWTLVVHPQSAVGTQTIQMRERVESVSVHRAQNFRHDINVDAFEHCHFFAF